MKRKLRILGGMLAVAAVSVLGSASALADSFEGFENPAWAAGGNGWNNYVGNIVRVGSGTNSIASSDGIAHAVLSTGSPAFTRFGGYSNVFGNGFSVSQDIYLDKSWAEGAGFNFSTAVNNQNPNPALPEAHLRDFIWHVGVVGGELLVNESNNGGGGFLASRLVNNANGGLPFVVSTSGWYTFETVFYDLAGALAVDFNLFNSTSSTPLYTATRTNPADLIATVVGGNRYGWFEYNNINGLAIDNTILQSTAVVPVPAAAPLGLLGMGLVAFMRRRKNAVA